MRLILLLFFNLLLITASYAQDCKYKSVSKGNKYVFLNAEGKNVFKNSFEYAEHFSQGLAAVKNSKGLWGYIDCTGNYVIEPQYSNTKSFNKLGIAIVSKGEKYGFINKANEFVVPADFKFISQMGSLYLANLNANDTTQLIFNRKGQYMGEVKDIVFYQKDSLFKIVLNKKFGLMDKDGVILLPPAYDYLGETYVYRSAYGVGSYSIYDRSFFNGEIAGIGVGNMYGLINRQGQIIMEPTADFDGSIAPGGMMRVKQNGKVGFINNKLQMVIPAMYEEADQFYESYAAVKLNGKYGFIDKSNKTILPFQYDQAYSPIKGIARVYLNGKTMVIDMKGNRVDIVSNSKTSTQSQTECVTCSYCNGSGKESGSQAVYEKCYICNGSGYNGYQLNSTETGKDRARWYGGPGYGKSICTQCKGTGRIFSEHVHPSCKVCNGKGCVTEK